MQLYRTNGIGSFDTLKKIQFVFKLSIKLEINKIASKDIKSHPLSHYDQLIFY